MTRKLAVLFGLFLLTAGCGLFSTRNPEAPDTGRRTWNPPRVPLDVLSNISSAMLERDPVNYLRSFDADHFRFEADPVALAGNPAMAGWGYAEESQYISRLLNEGTLPRDSLLSVVFTSIEQTPLADSTQIHAQYELTAGVALTGVPHHMAGTADFFVRMGGDGYLQIYRWRDFRTENQSTWSDFKSSFR
jgi:hypothetical protein